MKNILLLTDFSNNALNAIIYALEFFKGGNYHFFILNVHKVSKYTTGDLMTSSSDSSIYDSIIKNPKAELNMIIENCKIEYGNEDYTFEAICDYDAFVTAVSQTVQMKRIDLIVMGTNGATGAMEVIFGSNTISVIRNVDCPVLVIPQDYQFILPKNILFTTKYKKYFKESPLKPLQDIIALHNAELDILITNEKGIPADILKDAKMKIDSFFDGIKHEFYSISDVPVDIAMDCFVQIKKTNLIAKIIDKESFLKRFFKGSRTDEITYKIRVPLLIMHP